MLPQQIAIVDIVRASSGMDTGVFCANDRTGKV
jgi:hypothetical protein